MISRPDNDITRRGFMRIAGMSGLVSVVYLYGGCQSSSGRRRKSARYGKQVIVLGIDGLDPHLCENLMSQGDLPNLNRLRQAGGYHRLGTSIPPQSPVAWANFIVGADAGVHGLSDFIHRDPAQQCLPYFAGAKTIESGEGWDVGEHRIPLTFWPFDHSASHTDLRREGTAFWDYLDEAGIPSWIYDIPSNYPPSPSRHGHQFSLSGMGTPDLLGTYGTYQYFTTEVRRPKDEGGGMRRPLFFKNNTAAATLMGPLNTLLKKPKNTEVQFRIHRHPDEPLARVELQDHTIVLKEGEWSDWYQVQFPLALPSFLPDEHISGICRFYLQQVRPHFCLYVSPINIDPSDPGEQRITEPPDFAARISDDLGLFYTTGFQEDYKSLYNGIFSDEEYLEQANYVLQERLNLLDFASDQYNGGFLFFYFSSTDLQAHMFWWDSDEKHPVRSPEAAKKGFGIIADLYRRMDKVVGDVLKRYPDATFMVVSDHGFCNFRRQFNVNNWLRENGYLDPPDCGSLMDPRHRPLVDWDHTRAYGLGLNGLYLNLTGRERYGIVGPSERDALLEEIRGKLLAVRDPLDGQPAIRSVHRSDQAYQGPFVHRAPDLIVGYRRGYRCSWAGSLGTLSKEVIEDNDKAWSADHCMAAEELPGVVFSSKPILHQSPALIDLAPTILEEFGLRPPDTMTGRSLFRSA